MDFSFYFTEGINHIADFSAYDHMLFVTVLCAAYSIKEWRKVLVLLTAFTIGHCITLILAGLEILQLPQDLIETLIPITIFISAVANLVLNNKKVKMFPRYLTAAFFGLIHGAGFSNFYRIMFADIDERVVLPLLGFNLGIEMGQIFIVLGYFALVFILSKISKLQEKYILYTVSVVGALVSLKMIFA